MKYLLAVFMLHENNCRCLHWLSCGEAFDRAHKIADDLRSLISNDIDSIAEMSMRLDLEDIRVTNIPGILELLKTSSYDHIVVDVSKDYEKEQVENITHIILKDILDTIIKTYENESISKDIRNIGIKSALETLYDKYDKELRYLATRRSTESDED